MAFIDGVEGENTIMHMSNTLPEFRIAAPSNYIEEYLLAAGRCARPLVQCVCGALQRLATTRGAARHVRLGRATPQHARWGTGLFPRKRSAVI